MCSVVPSREPVANQDFPDELEDQEDVTDTDEVMEDAKEHKCGDPDIDQEYPFTQSGVNELISDTVFRMAEETNPTCRWMHLTKSSPRWMKMTTTE